MAGQCRCCISIPSPTLVELQCLFVSRVCGSVFVCSECVWKEWEMISFLLFRQQMVSGGWQITDRMKVLVLLLGIFLFPFRLLLPLVLFGSEWYGANLLYYLKRLHFTVSAFPFLIQQRVFIGNKTWVFLESFLLFYCAQTKVKGQMLGIGHPNQLEQPCSY